MVIYIAADHRGFTLKENLTNFLKNKGYEVVDLGNSVYDENDNYPDFAALVAEKVSIDENRKGILICGSGVGVDVVANKFPNIRSALVASPDQAYDSRNDDDANILSLGANYLSLDAAQKIVETWLTTPFSHEKRHVERLRMISEIELQLQESSEIETEDDS